MFAYEIAVRILGSSKGTENRALWKYMEFYHFLDEFSMKPFFWGWGAMLVYQRVSSGVGGEWSMSSSETTKMPQQKMFESCRHKGAGG